MDRFQDRAQKYFRSAKCWWIGSGNNTNNNMTNNNNNTANNNNNLSTKSTPIMMKHDAKNGHENKTKFYPNNEYNVI